MTAAANMHARQPVSANPQSVRGRLERALAGEAVECRCMPSTIGL